MNLNFIVSPSPHVHSGNSIPRCMYGVLIALIPAFLVSLYFFGVGALIVTLTSVVACVLFEYLIQKFLLKVKPTVSDGSAILTGVLLAFNLPANLPIWIICIGAFVAIAIGKMSFGGLGNNIFNPALVGRVFLLISFPVQMTTWPKVDILSTHYLDAETGATPLGLLKQGLPIDTLTSDMLLGNMGGSLGEVGAIALLIGCAYLLIRKVITWHIPVSILATAFIFSWIVSLDAHYAMQQLLMGGMLLGSIFMATDYVTSPMTHRGMVIYGICIGLLTIIIRRWGAYPEGMSFAILIMNGVTPLINKYVKPKRFGEVKK
ncbi:MAG: RnfABCDGE type electron transport complex subunit D [Porphyromonadaceae bacterium]|nr:RnfABCDGE type electron transport complex subunit D [Porphyromonadaceae bacterium]